MDHTEDTHTEDLDTETQMDATSGRESPVIAQTQKTIDRNIKMNLIFPLVP